MTLGGLLKRAKQVEQESPKGLRCAIRQRSVTSRAVSFGNEQGSVHNLVEVNGSQGDYLPPISHLLEIELI